MRTAVYLVFIVILGSCQKVVRPEKPEKLLPKDKMIAIMAESYTGNSARSIDNRTLRNSGVKLDSILYTKFDVDSITFAESNAYYASQLNEYIYIISEVEKVLSAKKKQVDSIIKEEANAERDSLGKKREDRKSLKDAVPDPKLIKPAKD